MDGITQSNKRRLGFSTDEAGPSKASRIGQSTSHRRVTLVEEESSTGEVSNRTSVFQQADTMDSWRRAVTESTTRDFASFIPKSARAAASNSSNRPESNIFCQSGVPEPESDRGLLQALRQASRPALGIRQLELSHEDYQKLVRLSNARQLPADLASLTFFVSIADNLFREIVNKKLKEEVAHQRQAAPGRAVSEHMSHCSLNTSNARGVNETNDDDRPKNASELPHDKQFLTAKKDNLAALLHNYNRANDLTEKIGYVERSQIFTDSLNIVPTCIQTVFLRAKCDLYCGKYDRAVADVSQYVGKNVILFPALVFRSLAYLRKGETVKGIEDVKCIIKSGIYGHISDLCAIVNELRESGDMQICQNYLRFLKNCDALRTDATFWEAGLFMRLKKVSDAKNNLDAVIAQNDASSIPYLMRAKINLGIGEVGQAAQDITTVLQKGATSRSLCLASELLRAEGLLVESRIALEKAVILERKTPIADFTTPALSPADQKHLVTLAKHVINLKVQTDARTETVETECGAASNPEQI